MSGSAFWRTAGDTYTEVAEQVLWNQDMSVKLSRICTRVIIVLALILAVLLPLICFADFFQGRFLIAPDLVLLLMPVYYAFCVPALIALVSLDRLLTSVSRNEVFTQGNVRKLRIISWCCFAAALILLASSFVSVVFFALAVLAAFFGVILRVVKNLFAAAVELKTENDFTI